VISLKDIGLSELKVVAVLRTVAASPGTSADRMQGLTTALWNAIKSEEVQKFLADRKFETDTELGEPFRKSLASLNALLGQYEATIKRFVQSGGK
jgi:tripartite-type tricarboxylate transporter receptor subunit TctC